MGLGDSIVRTERGCNNCATAVSNGKLGDLRCGILLFCHRNYFMDRKY